MFSPAMILTRLTIEACSLRGGFTTSYSTPSTRNRTLKSFLEGLDVDVAGSLLDGLSQQRVYKSDDGRLIRIVEEVLTELKVVGDVAFLFFDLVDDCARRAARSIVGSVGQIAQLVPVP